MPEKFLYALCSAHDEPKVFSGILSWVGTGMINFDPDSPLIVKNLLPHHLEFPGEYDHQKFELFTSEQDALTPPSEQDEETNLDYENSIGFVVVSTEATPTGDIEI